MRSDEPVLVLSVSRGPGAVYLARFHQAVVTVGRAPDCTLPLDDPSLTERHLRLVRRSHAWEVEAEGMVLLNGVAIAAPRAVKEGDVLLLGRFLLKIGHERPGQPASSGQDTGRLAEALAAEMAAESSLTLQVSRGQSRGASLKVHLGRRAKVGSGPEMTLRLSDAGVLPEHLHLWGEPEGVLYFEALGPVMLDGVPARSGYVKRGMSLTVGRAELRFPSNERRPWSRMELVALAAVSLLTVLAAVTMASLFL